MALLSFEDLVAPLAALKHGANPAEVSAAIHHFGDGAMQLEPADRLLARRSALEILQEKMIPGSEKLIDALLTPPKKAPSTEGAALGLVADTIPWPEPVPDGAYLFDQIERGFLRYMVFPDGGSVVATLTSPLSFVVDMLDWCPIIAYTSPVLACGKSNALELNKRLVNRPLWASNVTSAALFRTMEAVRPTAILDEYDTFIREHGDEELRGALNAGCKRGEAFIRCDGEKNEPRRFDVFGLKILAGIRELPATLRSRAISIPMRRRLPSEHVEKLRPSKLPDGWEKSRRMVARWVMDHAEEIKAAEVDALEGPFSDRAQDNWEPLRRLAKVIGGNWPEHTDAAMRALEGQRHNDDATAVQLLSDVRDYIESQELVRKAGHVSTAELLRHLTAQEDRPWGEWSHGKPMTPQALGRQLAPFGIHPGHWRDGILTIRGYYLTGMGDAFLRYLPPSSPVPAQPAQPLRPVDTRPRVSTRVPAQGAGTRTAGSTGKEVCAGCAGTPRDGARRGPSRSTWAMFKGAKRSKANG